jgi:hypothetical protein
MASLENYRQLVKEWTTGRAVNGNQLWNTVLERWTPSEIP